MTIRLILGGIVAMLAIAGLGSALIAALMDAARKDAEDREWGE